MPVTSAVSKVEANGNGVATVFSFNPVVIFEASDLQVYKTAVDGTVTLLAEGVGAANYAVNVSSYPGTGSVTYPSTGPTRLATGEVLTIIRVLPYEQGTRYSNQRAYYPDAIEKSFDYLTMLTQQLLEISSRSVQVPIGDPTDPQDLIDAVVEAAAIAQAAADVISGLNVVPATETQAGFSELSSQAEADAGTDDTTNMTPLKTRRANKDAIIISITGDSTAVTSGTNKKRFRMPYGFTLTEVRANLITAQTSGSILTVDINESGSTILSTKLTIDNTEKTSVTAATPPVMSDTALADDAEISIDVDQIGDGTAQGLKVTLIGYRA